MIQRLSLLLILCSATALQAADAPDVKKVLAAIPGEAAGFVIVPSIEQFDRDLQQASTRLGLQELLQVPPGMMSASGLLRQFLGLSEGLDTAGSLAVVFIPGAPADPEAPAYATPMYTALIVPATDPAALLKAAGAEPGEGGLWSLLLMGRPFRAAPGEGRVVLSDSADAARAVSAGKSSIRERLNDHDVAAFREQDILVWVDGDRMVKQFKPQLDAFMMIFTAMQGGTDQAAVMQAENAKKQMNMLLEGLRSALIGVSLGDQGLGLRFFLTSKPATELAGKMKLTRTTTDSLLKGLPNLPYLLALGQTLHPEASKEMAKEMDVYFKMLGSEASEPNKKHIDILQQQTAEWAGLVSGVRMSVSRLPAGAKGLLGASILMDVSDSKKCLDLIGKMIAEVKQIDPGDDADARLLLEALSFEKDQEKVESASVHQLVLDLDKFEDLEDEDLEDLQILLGGDGVRLRMAAVDDRQVALSFGGGTALMQTLIQQARQKGAPLEQDAGIRGVAPHLAKSRNTVGYVAVDRIVACIRDGQKMVDEEQLPVEMAAVEAPLALTSTGAETWSQMDLFLPTDLMVASKSFIMGMMGQPAAPPPSPAEAGSAE